MKSTVGKAVIGYKVSLVATLSLGLRLHGLSFAAVSISALPIGLILSEGRVIDLRSLDGSMCFFASLLLLLLLLLLLFCV